MQNDEQQNTMYRSSFFQTNNVTKVPAKQHDTKQPMMMAMIKV
jgi:hypothetical protein